MKSRNQLTADLERLLNQREVMSVVHFMKLKQHLDVHDLGW